MAHYVTEAASLKEGGILVIVIERDGRRIVIAGWRAWVIGAVAVVMTAMLAALAFLVLGIAVSMVAFLLIIMPAVALVVLTPGFSNREHGNSPFIRELP
jgi:hypothetical protein